MAAPLSLDLRERALAAYDEGGRTYEEVADQFAVGRATFNRWLRLRRETGAVDPRPHGGGREVKIGVEAQQRLREWIEESPDATLAELAARYEGLFCKKVALCIVWRALRAMGLTLKKRHSTRPSATAIVSNC